MLANFTSRTGSIEITKDLIRLSKTEYEPILLHKLLILLGTLTPHVEGTFIDWLLHRNPKRHLKKSSALRKSLTPKPKDPYRRS